MTTYNANFYLGLWVGGNIAAVGLLVLGAFREDAQQRRFVEAAALVKTKDVLGNDVLLPPLPRTVFVTNTVTVVEPCKREHSQTILPYMPFNYEPRWTNGYWYVPNTSIITNIDAGVYTNTATIDWSTSSFTNMAMQYEPSKKQVMDWLNRRLP